ncbi:MAG: hypothetical protein QM760_21595 [Nibricoccus sp.]
MKTKLLLAAAVLTLAGCETGGGSGSSDYWESSGSVYIGVGFYDPYFYGNPWYGGGAVPVRPPINRPPPRVGHH